MRILMPSRILDKHVGGNTTYARRLAEGLSIHNIEVDRIRSFASPAFTMLAETAEAIRRHKDAVLHYVADTGPLVHTRGPSVVTVHGVASRWIDTVRSPRNEAIWRYRVERAIKSTQHVITVSHSSARDIQEVFKTDPERITVIPHGIDVQKFSADVQLSPDVRSVVPDRFVLYVGNIEPRKNLQSLVAAFSRSEVQALGVPLVIAGRPAWDYSATMAAIESASNVHYLGFISDADRVALMQACDLFVFPSLYEGFGFPVLEALAAGTVVASSRQGSLAEVAGPSLTLEDLDPEGLARGVVEALTDTNKRSACQREGRKWAMRFSWDESVKSHIDVYKGVAQR